ncbi:ankyrin repeat domain-containing protein 27-like [Sycon ciliatum]|uniref:ankyrin repeat domain-containing protein 27-like n=1 Tax=Sycon ciliatum TaxID=27933 RepID=UPI0031F64A63
MTSYDEDILDNPFYQALSGKFSELYDVATNNGWMVCIPRLGSAARLSYSRKDFENHLLVPATECDDDGKRHFVTPNAKKVTIEGDIITTDEGYEANRSVRILFQETNYSSRDAKYIVLCVDQPLEGELCEEMKVATLLSSEDCSKFLFADSVRTQKQVDKLLKLVSTSLNILDGDALRNTVDAVRATITRTMQTVLKDGSVRKLSRQNQAYMANIKLAVETYVMETLHNKIFPASCALAAKDDAALNKKTRNLQETSATDFGLESSQCAGIPKARRELSSLNKYSTPLDKAFCLRRVILALSSPTAGQEGVTADDLLPLLILLLIRSDIANWKGNMLYITHFMSSAGSGEFVFVLSSFEAAVEHVMNDQVNSDQLAKSAPNSNFLRQHSDSSAGQTAIDVFFEYVRQNDLETVTRRLTAKLEVSNTILEQMCHPLCSCADCDKLLSGVSGTPAAGDPMEVAANSRDDLGRTALHVAAENGHGQMVELLLDCGAVASSTDYHSSTALHLACRRGHLSVVSVLLGRLDDINAQDNDGNTLLHLASANGHEEVARALFTLRVDVDCNVSNERGDTPLHLAARWGYESIVKLLVHYKASPRTTNRHKEAPSDCTHNQRIIALLQAEIQRLENEESFTHVKESEAVTVGESSSNASITTPGEDRTHPVADSGQASSGSNTPERGFSPAQSRRKVSSPKSRKSSNVAIRNTSSDGLTRKKSRGSSSAPKQVASSPVETDSGPLTGTVAQLQKEIDHLLKLCADGDVPMVRYKLGFDEEDATKSAVVYEESDLCHPLCDCPSCQNIRTRGAAIARLSTESCNTEGMTSLHVASLHGRRHVVQLLLRHGAMVNCKNNAKQTPLHLACQYNHQDIVMLLVDYNAKVSPPDVNGRTPLHNCCANGHDASAAILLFHGGDVNAPDRRGNSPLHQAAKWGHGTLVHTLLLHGASPFLMNAAQQKPIQLSQDEEVRSILLRAERGDIPIGSHRRRNSLGDHPPADEAMHAFVPRPGVTQVTSDTRLQARATPPMGSSRDRTTSLRADGTVPSDLVRVAIKTVSRDPAALRSSPSSGRSPRSSPSNSRQSSIVQVGTSTGVSKSVSRGPVALISSTSSGSSPRGSPGNSRWPSSAPVGTPTGDAVNSVAETNNGDSSRGKASGDANNTSAHVPAAPVYTGGDVLNVKSPVTSSHQALPNTETATKGDASHVSSESRISESAEPLDIFPGPQRSSTPIDPNSHEDQPGVSADETTARRTLHISPNASLTSTKSASSPRLAPRSASSRRLEELLNAIEDRSMEQLRTLSSLSSDVKKFNRRESLRRSNTNDRSGPSTASMHQYSITHFQTSRLRRVSTRDYSQPRLQNCHTEEDTPPQPDVDKPASPLQTTGAAEAPVASIAGPARLADPKLEG